MSEKYKKEREMVMENNTYERTKSLREQLEKRLAELKMTKQEAALKMDYSRPALSQYLNGKYGSDPTELEKKIVQFLEATGGMEGTGDPESRQGTVWSLPEKQRYYESVDFRSVIGLCRNCQEESGLGIVVGKSGFGKTHALKKYAALPRVAYIECDDTMSPRDLILGIENAVGMPRSFGTNWERVNRIRELFHINKGWLLIVDEADKLISKYTQKKMEILRGIYDQSEVGMVVAGELRLETEIKGNLVRFANRMDFYYRMKGLSRKEVEDYFSGYEVDPDAMQEFLNRAMNNQTGCFRLLDRTLNNVRRILKDTGETRITLKVIAQASDMMML